MTARIDGELSVRQQLPPQPSAGFASPSHRLHECRREKKLAPHQKDPKSSVTFISVESRYTESSLWECARHWNQKIFDCVCANFFFFCRSMWICEAMVRDEKRLHIFVVFFSCYPTTFMCPRMFSRAKANVCVQGWCRKLVSSRKHGRGHDCRFWSSFKEICHFTRNLQTKALCKTLWRLSISFCSTRKMR